MENLFSTRRRTGRSFVSSANLVDQSLFLARGYATAITDTGHLNTDPTWKSSRQVSPTRRKLSIIFRAVHEVTLATKLLVKDYYHTTTIAHSYFDGCSNGGKMGLIEAMRFPSDYDGIIAGSPCSIRWHFVVGSEKHEGFLDAYIPLRSSRRLALPSRNNVTRQMHCRRPHSESAKCAFNPDALVPETLTQKQATR